MTKQVKIYHNPRCSKSRETLNLLKENGVEPEAVSYTHLVLKATGDKQGDGQNHGDDFVA